MNINENTYVGEVAGRAFIYATHKDRVEMKHTIAFKLSECGRFGDHAIIGVLFDTDNVKLAMNHIRCGRRVVATGNLLFHDTVGGSMLKANNLLFLIACGK